MSNSEYSESGCGVAGRDLERRKRERKALNVNLLSYYLLGIEYTGQYESNEWESKSSVFFPVVAAKRDLAFDHINTIDLYLDFRISRISR